MPTRNGAKRMVIVVDDDPAVCSALKFSLEIEGFRVLTYPDAESLLRADLPSDACCVVDYYLPGMNGVELIKILRKRHADLPIVLMTTYPTPEIRAVANSDNFPIVEKPLLGNTLLDSIHHAWASEGNHSAN